MRIRNGIIGVAAGVLLAACGSDDHDSPDPGPMPPPMETRSFTLEVTNLTAGQPLSPLAAVAHDGSFTLYTVGAPSSEPLEVLAEGGDNSDLLTMADNHEGVHSTASGMAPVAPGATETLTLALEASAESLNAAHLDVVTMLVNTNDAIGAIQGQAVGGLEIGDSMTMTALSFDTGTEANTESADQVPGPAAAGGAQEGFNSARDDIADRVHLHPGTISQAHDLSSSDLTQTHRWDNPVLKVVITRTE